MRHFFVIKMSAFLVLLITSLSYGQELKIDHGPYLQYVTTSSATIMYTTNKRSIAWVEYFKVDGANFYSKERPKVFAASGGLKTIGKIHKIIVEGLEPDSKYAYRIYAKEVIAYKQQNSLFGNTVASRVYKREPLYFNTLKTTTDNTNFVLLTDVHESPKRIGKLLEDTNFTKNDFVIIDGDFINNFDNEDNLFKGSVDTLTQIFAKEKPFYMVRGNHETRGVMASKLKDYLHFPNDQYYYTFTNGNTFFIVLDSGEDKADSDIEYSSLADFDAYRTKQAKWLQKVTSSKAFKEANHRIVFSHIPPYGGGEWHGDIEFREKFMPILNSTDIDLMIAGHTHYYKFIPVTVNQNNFPILICDNDAKVNVSITAKNITATTIDIDKKVISQKVFERN